MFKLGPLFIACVALARQTCTFNNFKDIIFLSAALFGVAQYYWMQVGARKQTAYENIKVIENEYLSSTYRRIMTQLLANQTLVSVISEDIPLDQESMDIVIEDFIASYNEIHGKKAFETDYLLMADKADWLIRCAKQKLCDQAAVDAFIDAKIKPFLCLFLDQTAQARFIFDSIAFSQVQCLASISGRSETAP